MQYDLLNIYCDGGARGNPGPAAVGVVIYDRDKKILFEFGKKVGETTNNAAEYLGVIRALTFLKNENIKSQKIQFYLDSRLVVQQLNGVFKIKNPQLFKLFLEVRNLEREVGGEIDYHMVPRTQNERADMLVNSALNNYRTGF